MRAESTIEPAKRFEIEDFDGMATIRFYENVEQVERTDEEGEKIISWTYDEHILQVPSRPELESLVEENYEEWLALAIEEEGKPDPKTEKEIITYLESELELLQEESAFLLLEIAKGDL